MKIKDIMSTEVVHISMDDTLSSIHELFNHVNFHHLIVTEKGKLMGIVSDRDLLKSMSPYAGTSSELPRDAATMNKRAHQIMSRNPVTITSESSIQHAIDVLLEHKISCLPVVDEGNKIKGIITWKDLIKTCNLQAK